MADGISSGSLSTRQSVRFSSEKRTSFKAVKSTQFDGEDVARLTGAKCSNLFSFHIPTNPKGKYFPKYMIKSVSFKECVFFFYPNRQKKRRPGKYKSALLLVYAYDVMNYGRSNF